MADPRLQTPSQRRQNLSPLMAAQASVSTGEKVNACPFGCDMEDLDENGYCDHLVGFTTDKKTLELMVKGEDGRRRVMGNQTQPVRATDRLEQITCSYRVYRDVKTNTPAKAG